jgi:Class III cytochrome C family
MAPRELPHVSWLRMSWLRHLARSLFARRLAVVVILGIAIALSPSPASGGPAWDVAMGIGYAALALAAALYLYPLRGEGLPHRRLSTLSQHRRIGWWVLTLSILHTAILLLAQPLTSRYLLPSAPLYMLSGIAALVALAILVPTGLSARSSLRKARTQTSSHAPPASASTHATLAALLLALIGAHVIGSHQLIDTRAKALTLCLLLAIPLSWAALRGVRHLGMRQRTTRLLATTLPCSAAVVTLVLLPLPSVGPRLLDPVTAPPPLPIHFPHEKHTTVNCVTCHHNFVDKAGIGSCLDCHRRPRPDLTQSAEATFHTFCRDCHTELARTTVKHGPTRECSGCHLKPAASG